MADPVKNSKGSSANSKAATVTSNAAKGGAQRATKAASETTAAASRTAAKAGEAANSAGEAAKKKGEAAKDTLVSVGSKAGTAATVGVTAVKERKKITAGAAGGLLVLVAGAFALGRRSARRSAGPLTRLTDGRI
ncbi:hypothetical protein ACH4RA_02060 [Streptomyces smyrnaeus]|uniref:hypothetical protein n=1 Tax=Streptomyces TaxID=1883 RepID=UPI00160FAD30|nr:hypothetical protein [Streptomyces sp. B15]MBQ1124468.1 hypothetical protein [Streptomyces sp. B15]